VRAFVLAVFAALVLGVGFWIVLSSTRRSVDVAFKTEAVWELAGRCSHVKAISGIDSLSLRDVFEYVTDLARSLHRDRKCAVELSIVPVHFCEGLERKGDAAFFCPLIRENSPLPARAGRPGLSYPLPKPPTCQSRPTVPMKLAPMI
jgi:hypothetical protein